MFKNAFTAAALFLVVLLIGAFLIGAPAFASGETEGACQTFDFLPADQAATLDAADNPSILFIFNPAQNDQIESQADFAASPAIALWPQAARHNSRYNYNYESEKPAKIIPAIPAKPSGASSNKFI